MSNSNSILLGTYLSETLELHNSHIFNSFLSYSLVIENCLPYSKIIKDEITQHSSKVQEKRKEQISFPNEVGINKNILHLADSVDKINKVKSSKDYVQLRPNQDIEYNKMHSRCNDKIQLSHQTRTRIDNPELITYNAKIMKNRIKPKIIDEGIEQLFPNMN